MQSLIFVWFLLCWSIDLGAVYLLCRKSFGFTLFFAALTHLYVLLPCFFYIDDHDLLLTLWAGVVIAVLGFYLGFTLFGVRPERTQLAQPYRMPSRVIAALVILVLGLVSFIVLYLAEPNFISDLQTYEGRINFQGESGSLAFLLNQVIVALSLLIIWAWNSRRKWLAVASSIGLIYWAVYSNAKLSMLTCFAAWISIVFVNTWNGKIRARAALFAYFSLPFSLAPMALYSVYRGAPDATFEEKVEIFVSQLSDFGKYGILVGDFDGPYRVLVTQIRFPYDALRLGSSYFEQSKVLLPRGSRGDFLDLTEEFALHELGSSYRAGAGFAYSPWAEGWLNFGFLGFFLEAMLFGLLSLALWRTSIRIFGFNEIPVFFSVLMLALAQRGYFMGGVKAVVVYAVPTMLLWGVVRFFRVASGRSEEPRRT